MADTARTQSDLLTNLFQDGQTAGINEQDMRDLIVSLTPPHGGLYFSTPAATTIAVAGTFVKAAGTTTLTLSSGDVDDNSVSNRLRYVGTPTRRFQVQAFASVAFASGTNQEAALQIWHYDSSGAAGSLLTGSQARVMVPGTDNALLVSFADVALDTNDYLEMHVANITGTVNMTVNYGHMSILGMIV